MIKLNIKELYGSFNDNFDDVAIMDKLLLYCWNIEQMYAAQHGNDILSHLQRLYVQRILADELEKFGVSIAWANEDLAIKEFIIEDKNKFLLFLLTTS